MAGGPTHRVPESGREVEEEPVVAGPADDLHRDGEAVGGVPGRNGERRLPAELNGAVSVPFSAQDRQPDERRSTAPPAHSATGWGPPAGSAPSIPDPHRRPAVPLGTGAPSPSVTRGDGPGHGGTVPTGISPRARRRVTARKVRPALAVAPHRTETGV
jgi:hypothetical protein